jgi:hypothetical protein
MGFLNKLLGRNQASRPQAGVGAQVQPHHQTPQSPYHRGGTGVANGRTYTQQQGQADKRFIKQTFEFIGENTAIVKDNNDNSIEHLLAFNKDNTKIIGLMYGSSKQAIMDFQKYQKDGLQVGNLIFDKTTHRVAFIVELSNGELITLNKEDLNS